MTIIIEKYICNRCIECCLFMDDDIVLCPIDKTFYVDQYLEEYVPGAD